MSRTSQCYSLTPGSVTNSTIKFLERLISVSLFWDMETYKSVLLSCCPFPEQPYFTDQQLPECGETAEGAKPFGFSELSAAAEGAWLQVGWGSEPPGLEEVVPAVAGISS